MRSLFKDARPAVRRLIRFWLSLDADDDNGWRTTEKGDHYQINGKGDVIKGPTAMVGNNVATAGSETRSGTPGKQTNIKKSEIQPFFAAAPKLYQKHQAPHQSKAASDAFYEQQIAGASSEEEKSKICHKSYYTVDFEKISGSIVKAIGKGNFKIKEKPGGEKQLLIHYKAPIGKAVDSDDVESDSGLVCVCVSKKKGWHHYLIPEDNGNDRSLWADSVWFKSFNAE